MTNQTLAFHIEAEALVGIAVPTDKFWCAQTGRVSTKDALLETILNGPELLAQCAGYWATIEQQSRTPAFRDALESHLAEYGKSKLAASELAGNIINLAAGYALF